MRFFDSIELNDLEDRSGFERGSGKESLFAIDRELNALFQKTSPITQIVKWIEDADQIRPSLIRQGRTEAVCGWCPEESWQETYLFAHECANICRATLDQLEKVEMLTFCCVFQVLRSICAQSVRNNTDMTNELRMLGGMNGFTWLLTPARLTDESYKETAKHNLVRMREVIYGALKSPDIHAPQMAGSKNLDKDADKNSQELFLHLGKRIGLIAPRTGPGARFVLSDKVLRYLVLALIPPGAKMTLASFTDRMFHHYGMAVSGAALKKAVQWSYPRQELHFSELQKKWLEDSLLTAGFLIPLSDAVSQVHNPFGTDL
jgi:hypothetical protein